MYISTHFTLYGLSEGSKNWSDELPDHLPVFAAGQQEIVHTLIPIVFKLIYSTKICIWEYE